MKHENIDLQLGIELNTTGIEKFFVYIHSKDHFVPYESGRRLVKDIENWCDIEPVMILQIVV